MLKYAITVLSEIVNWKLVKCDHFMSKHHSLVEIYTVRSEL